MSGDNKMHFDPIPAPSRPDLPKVPDLPSLAALPPKPVATAPPTEPAPAPVSGSMLDHLWPSRAKVAIAAGVLSLVGSAGAMRYLWPAKPPVTAEFTPNSHPAPLPSTTHGTSGSPAASEFKKTELAPPMIAPVPVPAVEVPAITWSPTPSPAATASTTLPRIDLPDLVPVRATEPPVEAPKVEVKLPEIKGGSAPPAPSALALPTIGIGTPPPAVEAPTLAIPPLGVPGTTAAPPLPTVGELPKVDMKLELPKLDPRPVPTGPAVAPSLPEVAPLPNVSLTPPGLPKVEVAAPPKLELAPPPAFELKPVTPALELPNVGTPTLTPAPTTGAKTDYDVDLHYVKGGDSWAAVSKQYYGDERYAEALKGYNQNAAVTQLQRAEVPPIHVLRKNFATAIGRPAEKPAEWGAIQPSAATERRTNGGAKTYVVPTGGKSIKDIAADAYGDERYWGTVWESNPKLTPDKPIPEGTKIVLTSQSKIGE